MKTEEVIETEIEIKCTKRCSDYDDDCKLVKNHTHCWMGNSTIGRADGICPMVQTTN